LDIPASFAGHRIFLDFEGVLTSTTPYINGSVLLPTSGGYLPFPPFVLDTTAVAPGTTPELRLDGYVGDNLVLSRQFAGDTTGDCLLVQADDAQIAADGSDATRVWFMAVDRYGAPRPYVQGNVTVSLEGPGVLIGDTTFDFADAGGAGAVRGCPACRHRERHPVSPLFANTAAPVVSGNGSPAARRIVGPCQRVARPRAAA
jgi:hypothetical protein